MKNRYSNIMMGMESPCIEGKRFHGGALFSTTQQDKGILLVLVNYSFGSLPLGLAAASLHDLGPDLAGGVIDGVDVQVDLAVQDGLV